MAAATPGPLSVEPYTDDQCEVVTEKMTHVAFCNADGNGPNDAEFIAHAREDLPYALAEVKRLRAALEAIADKPLHNWDPIGVLARKALEEQP